MRHTRTVPPLLAGLIAGLAGLVGAVGLTAWPVPLAPPHPTASRPTAHAVSCAPTATPTARAAAPSCSPSAR